MPPKPEEKKDAKAAPAGKDAAGAGKGKGDKGKAKADKPEPPKLPTPLEVLHKNIAFVDKYVDTRDRLLLMRVMRYTGFVRKHVATPHIKQLVDTYVGEPGRKATLHSLLDNVEIARKASAAASDVTMAGSEQPAGGAASRPANGGGGAAAGAGAGAAASPAAVKLPKPNGPAAVEIDAYLAVLVLSLAAKSGFLSAAGEAASQLVPHLSAFNRRTLDFFQARAWSIAAAAAEARGDLQALVPDLLAAHRTAALRHDEYGQAVALNTVLRAHVLSKDFAAAQSLLSKAPFPEAVSTAQLVRHLYYTGRVRAVTLDYAEAHAALLQASRKAPPSALGFRAEVLKFDLLVQLLMGEIPERSAFSPPEPSLKRALVPYLALTSAVRGGDLRAFAAAVAAHSPAFTRDGTMTLVRRLEGSVIKAGLRRVAAAYSRISFADIAARLALGSAEDAEFLCAKAIADGIIDGTLDHDAACLLSSTAPNVYSTSEPADTFGKRIAFCLDVHNEAVRGMRYPPRPANAALESAEKAREREREEEEFLEAFGGDDDMEDDE